MGCDGRNDLTLILGRKESGKSYLACDLAADWPDWLVYAHDPQRDEAFDRYHRWTLANPPATRGTLVIIDEMQKLMKRNGDFKADWLEDLIWSSRHYDCAIICCALRPQQLNRALTGNVTRVFIGRLTGKNDIKYCVDEWGEQCEQARNLKNKEFLEIWV